VVEPPPSRLTALYAPRSTIMVASSSSPSPSAKAGWRPSAESRNIRLPSREKPSAVRGAGGTLLPWLAFWATPSTTSS
jgi:hypothetical protein